MAFTAHQLRPGMTIEFESRLWVCMDAVHKTPGNKRGFVQAKLRSILDGNQKDVKFSSTEVLERIELVTRAMQFLYEDGGQFYFMDTKNYEQVALSTELVGAGANYLLPDTNIEVTFHEEKAIGIKLPSSLEFKIIEAEPNMKSATASAQFKNAKIETGVSIKVPQFIEVGERVRINPETSEYIERAK